jgi:3-deoxy-D-manno-octulosonic-acid transferase
MRSPVPILTFYRGLTRAATPVSGILLGWRQWRGKEDGDRLHERKGVVLYPRPQGQLAWLHGASVGEGLALLPLVEQLVKAGTHVVLTTGTTASAQILQQRMPPGSLHQYSPLDVPRFVARFLNHWQPNLAIFAESELWPNLLIETSQRRIPLLLVNGRLSTRSFQRWRRLPNVVASLLARVDLCLAQTHADAARFRDLGAPRVVVTGNMKFDVAPPPADPAKMAELVAAIGARPVWVAASTHRGEEIIAAQVHRRLQANFTDLLTIVVPRHANRGEAIGAEIAQQGLDVALRGDGAPIVRSTQVYVANTMGEIGLFYRAARLVFMGKSLVGSGGQNPIEPAKLGCAILHGPNVSNFAEIYDLLDRAHGAVPTADADTLAHLLSILLRDGTKLRAMARAAAEMVNRQAGATARTMQALEPYIMQLMMERRR